LEALPAVNYREGGKMVQASRGNVKRKKETTGAWFTVNGEYKKST